MACFDAVGAAEPARFDEEMREQMQQGSAYRIS